MKNITGSQAVIESLLAEHTDTIFGYPGGAIMPIYDALYDYKNQINHILVRHEQGAIHSAQGYARASGKVGVVFATSGPGATNLITGLADAQIDSTPLVCITGQVSSGLLGTDAFQETDVIGISMPVTKWNCQVTQAKDIASTLAKAFYIAKSGRPGPVLVDITKDAQFEMVDFLYQACSNIRSYHPMPIINMDDINEASQLINQAKKPYVLIGQGILLAKAQEALLAFINKTNIPVASTLLGLGAVPTIHPQYVGYLGMHGNYAPNIKTNECDVLIAIGMRFDDRVTGDVKRYATQAKIIHIDIDASELNKIIQADICIHADANDALQALLPLVNNGQHQAWLQEFNDAKQQEVKAIYSQLQSNQNTELKMVEVVEMLSQKTKGEAIIVSDVGQHQMVTAQHYQYQQAHINITSGGLGTMGFALPASIGAKLGNPAKTVVAIIGDGGFQMTIQELGTILQFGMAVKILILNNNFLGMVRQWQQLFFDRRYSFTEIKNPDFVKIASGYGIEGQKITDRQHLSQAMDAWLASPNACLLEVVVAQEDNVFPMMPTGASVSEVRLS